MKLLKCLVMILFGSICTNCIATSHEIAINKLQLELSQIEIVREKSENLKKFSKEIMIFSAVLALYSMYKKGIEGPMMIAPLLIVLNMPRIIFEFCKPMHDEHVMLLRKQIERLKIEEIA